MDAAVADEQFGGDGGVAQTSGHQCQHVAFAGAEPAEDAVRRAGGQAAGGVGLGGAGEPVQ
ncbi:hypothetical protein [Amycolatopsis mediterranei]|uniref:hypothetical protein n=1 Tax=Amycolatopsis mediterranei TaxID=33910 RepID=UPI003F4D883E